MNLDAEPTGLTTMLRRAFHRWCGPKARHVSTDFKIGYKPNQYSLPPAPVRLADVENVSRHLNNPDGRALVWAYTSGGDDELHRGDTHGAIGIAQAVAKKLDGDFIHVHSGMIEESFAHTKEFKHRLQALRLQSGFPDLVIGHHSHRILTGAPGEGYRAPTFLMSRINEDIPGAGIDGLVPHHLTPETLQKAGAEFEQHYPDLPRPLVGVFIANAFYYGSWARRLAEVVSRYKQGTVFLCPNWRTGKIEPIKEAVRIQLAYKGAQERIRLIAPSYESMKTGYNPYAGLIDRADHAVLWGGSQSMQSEIISQGKTLHATQAENFKTLRQMGYLRPFDEELPRRAFVTKMKQPLNATNITADAIVEEFDRLARLRTFALRMG